MATELHYRKASSADVRAMAHCRAGDADAGPADPRMLAYLEGQHHPRQALAPRTAFVACLGAEIVGYIAGHETTRYGCAGELQYLYVAPDHRRQGVATGLLRCLAAWFHDRGVRRVCVNVNVESEGAAPFYQKSGAVPLNRYWYVWHDIDRIAGGARDDSATLRHPHLPQA